MRFRQVQPASSCVSIQGAREKLRSSIFDRVNTCNALLHEVRQRSQARDVLQWRLQQLLDVRIDDKQHQEQVQVHRHFPVPALPRLSTPGHPMSHPADDSPTGEQH